MLKTPEFWVLISFILFLLLFGKKILSFLRQSLDEHQQKIAHQLEESKRLHDEALNLLNAYKKKHKEALKQAEDIISFAKEEANTLKKEKELEFEKFMKQREKTLHERIENEKEEAISALRKQVLDEAIKRVEAFLATQSDEKKKLTQASLKDITDFSRQAKKSTTKQR